MTDFSPRQKHHAFFYRSALAIIAKSIAERASYTQIVDRLNAAGLPSPIGGRWSIPSLAGILNRMRNGTGHFRTAALELHLHGELSKAETKLLLRLI